MDFLDDVEMQMLASRTKRNVTKINEFQNKCNKCVQSLPSVDTCNRNISEEVMKVYDELQHKENEIRYMNIEKDMLSIKEYHLDQSIKDKLMDIEKLQKTKEEVNNATDKIYSDVCEQLLNYEAEMDVIANKYRESGIFYNEDLMRAALQETNAEIQNLQHELKEVTKVADALEDELKNLDENVPDLIEIAGKEQLQKELENSTTELEKLQKIHDELVTEQRILNPHYAD